MRTSISDTHLGDPDLKRWVVMETGLRLRGIDLLESYAAWAHETQVVTTGNGDIFDYTGTLARDLVEYDEILYQIGWHRRGRSTFIGGNHDRLIRGAMTVGCLPLQHLIDEEEDGRRLAMLHGHTLDPFPWEERPMLREWILKNGRRIDLKVPMADEMFKRMLRQISNRLMPRGARFDEEYWVDKAVEEARRLAVATMIIGHNHLLFAIDKGGILVISLGAWTPRNRRGGETITPGVWSFEARQLYQWTMDGLKPVETIRL